MDMLSLWDDEGNAEPVRICSSKGCNRPAGQNHKQCDECRAKKRETMRQFVAKRRAAGVCRMCGLVPTPNGKPCESCNAKAYERLRSRYKEQHYARVERGRREIRNKVLAGYGGVCACCKETEPKFLTVDHINNDGRARRREFNGNQTELRWIVANNFPPGYQILCYNCNCARKNYGGICPHHIPLTEPEPHVPWKPIPAMSKEEDR